jgi:hypothetical protein
MLRKGEVCSIKISYTLYEQWLFILFSKSDADFDTAFLILNNCVHFLRSKRYHHLPETSTSAQSSTIVIFEIKISLEWVFWCVYI